MVRYGEGEAYCGHCLTSIKLEQAVISQANGSKRCPTCSSQLRLHTKDKNRRSREEAKNYGKRARAM